MLTREQVFEVINTERAYQDSTYDPNQVLDSGSTRLQRDNDVTAHIVLLDAYVDKARKGWVGSGSNKIALQQIAKVAAIAIRALERSGGSEQILNGLR